MKIKKYIIIELNIVEEKMPIAEKLLKEYGIIVKDNDNLLQALFRKYGKANHVQERTN